MAGKQLWRKGSGDPDGQEQLRFSLAKASCFVIALYLALGGLDSVQFSASQDKTDTDILEEVQWRPPA